MSVLLRSIIFNMDNNIYNISIRYHQLYVSYCHRLPATLLEQPWRSMQDRAFTTLFGKSQVPIFEPDESVTHAVFVSKSRTDVDLPRVFKCFLFLFVSLWSDHGAWPPAPDGENTDTLREIMKMTKSKLWIITKWV